MTNFDRIKDTSFGDLFRAMNGDEPSMEVLASFIKMQANTRDFSREIQPAYILLNALLFSKIYGIIDA